MYPPRIQGMARPGRHRGFTLVELMVVLVLVALVGGVVALSLRPSTQQQLSREGERLALWLEGLRSLSRGTGRAVEVRVDAAGARTLGNANDAARPERLNWLYADTTPVGTVTLTLGPEPILPPQQLQLTRSNDARVRVQVSTPGLGPWTVQ